MDTTTAVVIFIFVISIFSGMGNNQGYHQPANRPTFPTAPVTAPSPVAVPSPLPGQPDPTFASVGGAATQPAIQNYIQRYRSSDQSLAISTSLVRHAETYNMNPKLVAALIARESKFNPRALSSSGAGGLGQLLPSTAKGLGVNDVFDIDQNAMGTTRYFRSLIDRFKGNVNFAIAGYLEGPNAILRNNGYSTRTGTYVNDILTIYNKI
ncbi:MAG: lytic transglycosylase domain-containing protein [Candidatus Margulisiibacteriota bacterium]